MQPTHEQAPTNGGWWGRCCVGPRCYFLCMRGPNCGSHWGKGSTVSVEIRVRRNENGQPRDEVIEHKDTGDLVYGYHMMPDNSFRVYEVLMGGAERRVNTLRVYSSTGYLEVAGTLMSNNMGYSDEELRNSGFACGAGLDDGWADNAS